MEVLYPISDLQKTSPKHVNYSPLFWLYRAITQTDAGMDCQTSSSDLTIIVTGDSEEGNKSVT